MTLALPLALLGALAQGRGTDTTISVRSETRLEVHNLGGDIVVRTWERNAVRVQAEHSSRDVVDISYGGAVLKVSASGRRGAPHSVDYTITVPAAMDLNLSGTYSDVTVEHSAGRVVVETVQGDVTVHGGKSLVNVHSVSGEVRVSGVSGRLEANSTNGEVTVEDADGEVYAETVNGSVTLRNIRSDNVSAVTVNGDVVYQGTVRDNGQYRLSTHNGDVTMTIPTGANATVSVSTFNGDFESDFPVTLTGTKKGKRFNFTIGSGSATLELESFEGSIKLIRP
jgi:DUF4097 and DUF4098 domain-containing protein YvlB